MRTILQLLAVLVASCACAQGSYSGTRAPGPDPRPPSFARMVEERTAVLGAAWSFDAEAVDEPDDVGAACTTSAAFPDISSRPLYVWDFDDELAAGAEDWEGYKVGTIVHVRCRGTGEAAGGDPAVWIGMQAWTLAADGSFDKLQDAVIVVDGVNDAPLGPAWRDVAYRLDSPVDGRLVLVLRAFASGLAVSVNEIDSVWVE